MMNYQFVQEMYTQINNDLLGSSISINATIAIFSEDVGQESTYKGMSDRLSGQHITSIKQKYPQDLNRFYRVRVYPLERSSVKIGPDTQIVYGLGGKHEPYDMWISCPKKTVMVRDGNTYFTYAENVQITGIDYIIKGVVAETFGTEPMLHIFLVKETNV